MSDLSTYLDYGSTEISDDLNPERARQPEKQEPSNERKKMLADSLSTALEYGRRLAVEEGLYPHEGDWMHADIPDNDIILGANDWLLDQTGFTYDEFVDGMESTGLSDAVEWAWSLQGEPTVQLDVAHMARQGNPWQFVWDVGSNALGAAGSLLAGDLGGARDAWTEKDGHMYGYAPNPYGSQVGNALGVHNWTDAGFALLDLADIASFAMGGMVIAPIRQAAANAQTRLGNHEIARVMGGKRMREEFAEQAARAADTELRTIWDNISTGEREVIEADYRAVFPDADPDPADMMRWYEEDFPKYFDRDREAAAHAALEDEVETNLFSLFDDTPMQQGPPGTPPAKDMEDVADQLLDVVAGDSFTAAQNRIRFLVTEIDEALWNPSGSFTDEQIQKIVDLKQLLLDEGGRFPPRWQKKVTFDDDIFDPPDTFRFSDEYHNNISGITAAQREAYAEWRNELGIPELREGPPGTPRLGDVQGFPTALTPEEQTQDLFKLGSEDWARISDRLSPTERGQVADAYLAIHGGLGNEADMLQWYEMQRAAGFSQAEAAAIAEGPPGTPEAPPATAADRAAREADEYWSGRVAAEDKLDAYEFDKEYYPDPEVDPYGLYDYEPLADPYREELIEALVRDPDLDIDQWIIDAARAATEAIRVERLRKEWEQLPLPIREALMKSYNASRKESWKPLTNPTDNELIDMNNRMKEMHNLEDMLDAPEGPPGTPERDPLDRRPGPEQRRPYPDTYTPDEIDQIVRNEGGLTDKEIRDLMDNPPNE